MLKKPDVLEKNKFHIRVQHLQIYQNQIVLPLSFFCVAKCNQQKILIIQLFFNSFVITITYSINQ